MRVRNIGRFAIAGVGFRRSRIAKIRVLTWTRNSFSIFEIGCSRLWTSLMRLPRKSLSPLLRSLCHISGVCVKAKGTRKVLKDLDIFLNKKRKIGKHV